MILQTAQHTRSSQSVVMTAVVSANTDSAASALQCRLCLFVSGLVTKNAPEMTSKRLRSQHFLSFSQFYSISDRSVDVAPSRISTLHPSVQTTIYHNASYFFSDTLLQKRYHLMTRDGSSPRPLHRQKRVVT